MEKVLIDELGSGTVFPARPFFVDFLRDAPEATGDEPDDADLEAPKVYEKVQNNNNIQQQYTTTINNNNKQQQYDYRFHHLSFYQISCPTTCSSTMIL